MKDKNPEATILSIGAADSYNASLTEAAKILLEKLQPAMGSENIDEYNVDIHDVSQILKDTGVAALGAIEARGANRVAEAVEKLISLFTKDGQIITIASSKALLHILASADQEPEKEELISITENITDELIKEAELTFCYIKDNLPGDTIKVSLLASVPLTIETEQPALK